MKTKITGLLCLLVLFVALSGCGGGGGNPFDPEPVKEAIKTALNQFESGVEAYDVTKMLANFWTGADFVLTIQEGSWDYDKDYTTLSQELQDDATAQAAWRKPVAEGGHAYVLDLVLGTYSFSNLSESGGSATQTFEVRESAADIPEATTDHGNITWTMAKKTGVWYVMAMTIEFQGVTSSRRQNMNLTSNNHGFSFGTTRW